MVRGAKGELAVLVSLLDKPLTGTTYDMFSSTFDGTRWSEPANLTQNQVRGTYKDIQGGGSSAAQVSTAFEPDFGSGRFEADGHLALLLVNTEHAAITSTTATTVDYGVLANPDVYFLRH